MGNTYLPLHPLSIMKAFHINLPTLGDNEWTVINQFLGTCELDEALKWEGTDEQFWKFALNYLFGKEVPENSQQTALKIIEEKYKGKLCQLCNLSTSVTKHAYYKESPRVCNTCERNNADFRYVNVKALPSLYNIEEGVEGAIDIKAGLLSLYDIRVVSERMAKHLSEKTANGTGASA